MKSIFSTNSIVLIVIAAIFAVAALIYSLSGFTLGIGKVVIEEHWDPEIWDLLQEDAPAADIIAAINRSPRDIDGINRAGSSLLVVAIRHHREDLIPWLVDNGMHVDGQNKNGLPLMHAVDSGCLPCAEVLINLGANPHIGKGWTPFQFAKDRGANEYVELFTTLDP